MAYGKGSKVEREGWYYCVYAVEIRKVSSIMLLSSSYIKFKI